MKFRRALGSTSCARRWHKNRRSLPSRSKVLRQGRFHHTHQNTFTLVNQHPASRRRGEEDKKDPTIHTIRMVDYTRGIVVSANHKHFQQRDEGSGGWCTLVLNSIQTISLTWRLLPSRAHTKHPSHRKITNELDCRWQAISAVTSGLVPLG